MNKWYEVYITNNEGSRTIEICSTYKEAKTFKDNFVQNDLGIDGWQGTVHIDVWQNKDNPERIEAIE